MLNMLYQRSISSIYYRYPVDNLSGAWFPLNYCVANQAVAATNPLRPLLDTLVGILC